MLTGENNEKRTGSCAARAKIRRSTSELCVGHAMRWWTRGDEEVVCVYSMIAKWKEKRLSTRPPSCCNSGGGGLDILHCTYCRSFRILAGNPRHWPPKNTLSSSSSSSNKSVYEAPRYVSKRREVSHMDPSIHPSIHPDEQTNKTNGEKGTICCLSYKRVHSPSIQPTTKQAAPVYVLASYCTFLHQE